jgi:hypothetical protein
MEDGEMKARNVIGFTSAALLVVLGAASVAVADKPAATTEPWKIVGQLEEACRCNAACPCWFDSKPSHANCGGGQVLFIEKGTYGATSLDGLAVGMMGQSPDGKGMMESFGEWDFINFYIDEKANPQQREALKVIAHKVMAGGASAKTEDRITPITRTIDGKEHNISLGTYGNFHGHLIEGGLGGSVKITNPPGADPLHAEYNQGLTTSMAYTDAGQNWNFQGSNYMFGTFAIDSVQYEKYAAGLAQKMQKMQKK